MYVRDDIPCKLIPMRNSTTKGFFIELKLRKKKWLLRCYYNPQRRFISNHLIDIGRNLDILSTNYDNILLSGDFNAEVESDFLTDFCDLYGMKSLIKIPMCYKNLANSARIDLMLSNSKRSFQNSCTIETRLSINTVLNIYFHKRKAKVISYRDYQNFLNEEFWQQVLKDILSFLMNLFKYFLNKTILKATMDQSRLRKKFLKTRSNEDKKVYNTQRNYCLTLVRRAKQIIVT